MVGRARGKSAGEERGGRARWEETVGRDGGKRRGEEMRGRMRGARPGGVGAAPLFEETGIERRTTESGENHATHDRCNASCSRCLGFDRFALACLCVRARGCSRRALHALRRARLPARDRARDARAPAWPARGGHAAHGRPPQPLGAGSGPDGRRKDLHRPALRPCARHAAWRARRLVRGTARASPPGRERERALWLRQPARAHLDVRPHASEGRPPRGRRGASRRSDVDGDPAWVHRPCLRDRPDGDAVSPRPREALLREDREELFDPDARRRRVPERVQPLHARALGARGGGGRLCGRAGEVGAFAPLLPHAARVAPRGRRAARGGRARRARHGLERPRGAAWRLRGGVGRRARLHECAHGGLRLPVAAHGVLPSVVAPADGADVRAGVPQGPRVAREADRAEPRHGASVRAARAAERAVHRDGPGLALARRDAGARR